jgi:hypothetical protein
VDEETLGVIRIHFAHRLYIRASALDDLGGSIDGDRRGDDSIFVASVDHLPRGDARFMMVCGGIQGKQPAAWQAH